MSEKRTESNPTLRARSNSVASEAKLVWGVDYNFTNYKFKKKK